MSSQPLLDHEDSVSLDLEDHLLSHNIAHPEQHLPAAVTKRGLWAFVSGLVLTAAAITLHYSGLEDVDLSWQDDVCYSGDKLVYQGLSVDACLNRDATDQGTDCGKPAADAYCKLMNANYMTLAYGTITLGNHFLGGRIGFAKVCCDVGRYAPAWSRMILLLGGTLLLYALARITARLVLRSFEVTAAWLGLEAGEVLYSLLGLERPARWLAFSASLVYWVDFTLWRVWCGAGVDCESHGSDTRRTIKNLAEVLLIFAAGALCAKAAPRIISVRYLYAGEFAKVRATMRIEGLLDSLTQPEVREVIAERRKQQQERAQAAAAAAAEAQGASTGAATATGAQTSGRVSSARRRKPLPAAPQPPPRDLSSLLASGYAAGSAVDRFRTFLNRYSTLTEEEVSEQAQAQGAQLYGNLVGAWDVDLDGSVGQDDFLELFKRVGAPPGFKSPAAAARTIWYLFDLDRDGRLTRTEFMRALENLYQQRANTAKTVLSNESAVRSLETAIGFVLYTLLAFAAARILGFNAYTGGQSAFDFFTTYVLALSFIFGDTVRSVFRSTVYLFAEQPYSVGDYLELDDELWMVVSFDLLFTQLRKWEYNQYAKVPNDQLMDSRLVNVSRGGCFKDTVCMSAPLALSMDSIKEIKAKLLEAGAARPKDIVPDSPHIKIDTVDSAQIMTLMLEWVLNFPPGDRQRVDDTREYMVAACKEALCGVGIMDETLKLEYRLARATKKK